MQQINKHEIKWLLENYDTIHVSQLNYWANKLQQRKKELTPLFNECCSKGISIQEISPELNEEWNKITLILSKVNI